MITWPANIQALIDHNAIDTVETEFVRFLYNQDHDVDVNVLLAAAACIQAQMNGHVCLDLNVINDSQEVFNKEIPGLLQENFNSEWKNSLEHSDLVATDGELKPLVFEDGRLYLHRYWKYEKELASWLIAKAQNTSVLTDDAAKAIQLSKKNKGTETDWQEVALILSFIRDLLILSGGPGTGKTYTVLNIIAAHNHFRKGELKVAVAAPTGKAARRLTESIHSGKMNMDPEIREKINISDEALTVHKLLGSNHRGTHFRFNEENKLPYDMVIVDEASMLDINLWINLIRAIPDQAKLIVLGDKDQLASVEAGSILGDICGGGNDFSIQVKREIAKVTEADIRLTTSAPAINDSVIFLNKSYRFDENKGIKELSDAINRSDDDKVIELLRSPNYPELRWMESTNDNLMKVIEEYAVQHYHYYTSESESAQLKASNELKILCALRKGHYGVEFINAHIEQKIKASLSDVRNEEWYPGRIIMATKNDAVFKIRNGEIGICRFSPETEIQFEGEQRAGILAGRLQHYEPAYALTIHKSQGSEYENVAVILPKRMVKVLSKEILYTSVTRARRSTLIIGNEDIIRKTVTRSIARNSGLKQRVWQDKQ